MSKNGEIVAPEKRMDDMRSFLKRCEVQIARALPRHMNPERMLRVLETACRQNGLLLQADQMSFVSSIITASQLGLEPNVRGSCYLIPFWNSKRNVHEVQLIPGYQGLMDIARRSKDNPSIMPRAVFEGDDFRVHLGTDASIHHIPKIDQEPHPAKLVAVYAVATLLDGRKEFDVIGKAGVDAVKFRSPSVRGKKQSTWDTDYVPMALKTVIRRLCKYLPASIELQTAIALDELHEAGQPQNLGLGGIIDIDPAQLPPPTGPKQGKGNRPPREPDHSGDPDDDAGYDESEPPADDRGEVPMSDEERRQFEAEINRQDMEDHRREQEREQSLPGMENDGGRRKRGGYGGGV